MVVSMGRTGDMLVILVVDRQLVNEQRVKFKHHKLYS